MKHGTLGHRGSDKLGLSERVGVLDREAPTSKRQCRWWEYVTSLYANSTYYHKGVVFTVKDGLLSALSAAAGLLIMLAVTDKTLAVLCGSFVIALVNFCLLLYKSEHMPAYIPEDTY